MLRALLSEGNWRARASEEEDEWSLLTPSTCALLRPRQHLLADWVISAHDSPHEVFMEACEPASARALNEFFVCDDAANLTKTRTIRRVKSVSEEEFFVRHMLGNEPVLLERDDEVSCWPARKWGTDLDVIEAQVGRDLQVPVTFDDETCQRRVNFGEFADSWREGRRVYLKDWAFKLEGFEYIAPTIPRLFARFRNWLSRKHERDYCFLYLGVKGTNTGLHSDVLNSYSWSANVKGTKMWRLLPASHTHLIHDISGRHVAANFYSGSRWVKCRCGTVRYFPLIDKARPIKVTQTSGQVMFVPSGWYHTVENLENTLSINANWINACNAVWTLPRLEDNFDTKQDFIFGGGNHTKKAFALRLVESINDDEAKLGQRPRNPPSDDDLFPLFQMQRAAAMLRLLAHDHVQGVTDAIEKVDRILRSKQFAASFHLKEKLEESIRLTRKTHGIPIEDYAKSYTL